MEGLSFIAGLREEEAGLLEAAGYADARNLSKVDAAALHAELNKANDMLQLMAVAPDSGMVDVWVEAARRVMAGEIPIAADPAPVKKAAKKTAKETAKETAKKVAKKVAKKATKKKTAKKVAKKAAKKAAEEVVETPVQMDFDEAVAPVENVPLTVVNYEADPDVQDMIMRAPFALPIPNRELAERGIPPSEVGVAAVLNRVEGDLEVRVSTQKPKKEAPVDRGPRLRSSGLVQVADYRTGGRRGIDSGRVRTLDDAREGVANVKPLEAPMPEDEDDRIRLLRTAREATNRGKDPNSHWFVRGVLHDQPIAVWLGCFFVILFQIAVPMAIVSAPLLILSDHQPERFGWVPSWLIAFPIAVPLVGLICLMTTCRVRCRVCGQKVLMPRHCRKNVKAHHVYGLGYVLPLAVHTIIFRWFNCTFCGTSVRIKE